MIGIFDSGSGGLTVLKVLREEMPSVDVVYFGDIKNAPYGEKTREELLRLTVSSIRILKKCGATRILSACNSVSASLAVSLFDAFSLEPGNLIEMVGPTVSYFRNSSARIVLLATPATVSSGIYQDAFATAGKVITTLPVPDLAGAIEFGEPEAVVEALIRKSLSGADLSLYDVLILGCTHYPLVTPLFEKAVPPSLAIFDPAYAVAERAKKSWWPQEVGDGVLKFIISRDSEHFHAFAEKLFPNTKYSVEVVG
jgi:glutamate racemase